jgi:O-antigen ligase
MIASFPALTHGLRWRTLRRRPWAVCVLALLPSIILTELSRGSLYGVHTAGAEFAKILIYYLLLLGLIDNPRRLRQFLLAVALFVTGLAALALLQYHQIIDLPALSAMVQNAGEDPETGEAGAFLRLMATGFFHDPNDFSLVLGAAVIVGLFWVIERRGFVRIFWGIAVGVLAYAFILTRSRGGFIGLVAGGGIFLINRFGWRRAVLCGLLLIPIILVVGGRQTSIDIGDTNDTAQGRIHLWRDSLVLFHGAPVLGIGFGQLAEENGLVAHNSYVHAFAELGMLGGTLFVGAWYLTLAGLRKARGLALAIVDDSIRRWRPYVLGMAVTYSVGLFSLTRCYVLPTYLVLGAAAAYADFIDFDGAFRFTVRLCGRIALVGIVSIVIIHLFVRVFAR